MDRWKDLSAGNANRDLIGYYGMVLRKKSKVPVLGCLVGLCF